MNNGISSSKKINPVMLLAIVLSSISFLLLGLGFYLVSTPKILLLQSLAHIRDNADEVLGNYNSDFILDLFAGDKIKVNSEIGIKLNTEELFEINFSYLENKTKEKSKFDFDLSQKNQALMEIDGLFSNNNIYFKIKDIMDYYYTEFPYTTVFNEVPVDDYQKVLNIFYSSVKDGIKEDNIVKTKETINLGKNKKKVNKLSYKITSKMVSDVLIQTIDKVLENKDLLKSLSESYKISEDQLKKELNTYKDSLKNPTDSHLYYNVYYYGFNNIVMYEVEDSDACIQIYQYDNKYELITLEKTHTTFKLEIEEINNQYRLTGMFDKYTYTGNLSIDDRSIYLDLNVKNVMDIRFNQTIIENKNYQVKTELAVNIEGTLLGVDMNTIYDVGGEVNTSGLISAKDINDMTEIDMQEIITNIQKHPFLSNIYNLLLMYSGSLGDSQSNVLSDSNTYIF